VSNYHLVILKRPYLEAILAGRKRVESRFAKARRAPFGRVLAGDKLFLKQSSGAVCATASVAAVKSFEDLTPKRIRELRTEYNHLIVGSDQYWQSRADCAFGFLVWLDDVRAVEPIRISKKDWRAWVILTEKENFGLLKADGQKRGIKK
jgi:ASC-1-like (ASCH) protein